MDKNFDYNYHLHDFYDYTDYENLRDWGWDTEAFISVPGFGFMPPDVDRELNVMTQVSHNSYL